MTDYSGSHLILESRNIEPGSVSWQSPSNIAIIKYWGKHGRQLPRNPSLSATLSRAVTSTTLSYGPNKEDSGKDQIALSFLFHGKEQPAFASRIQKYFESLLPIYPFLRQLQFEIKSENSFPHSSGIASSASAMSALALCLCSLEDRLFGSLPEDDAFDRKASYIARLGSGSACRSVYGHWALWGQSGEWPSSNDTYARPLGEEVHASFRRMKDAILIVSSEAKPVSSSAGHQLMEEHPFAESRYAQARKRLHYLIPALRTGDWEALGSLAEAEAMTLHGLMLSAARPYILLRPNTLAILEKVRQMRKDSGLHLYFTLDAGPNVHLLYPETEQEQVEGWIREELLPFCSEGEVIFDQVGEGPEEL